MIFMFIAPQSLSELLLYAGWKTEDELATMSEDDKRNTAIVKLNERSSVSISDLQAFPSTGNTRYLLGFGSITAYLLNSYTKTISQLPGTGQSISG